MRTWHIAVSSLALSLLVVGCEPQAETVATVAEVSGDVTLKPDDQSDPVPAEVSQALSEGNVVVTGANATARIVFQSGSDLVLSPDSRLRIQAGGSKVMSFGAVLLSGDVQAKKGSRWAIGTPFGIVTLGSSDASLRVDDKQGLSVLVGDVELLKSDGATVKVGQGELLALDGLVVKVGNKRPEMVLEEMTITLLANPKRVKVKHKGETEFAAPKENEELAEGDAVRTEDVMGTRMKVGQSGEIELGKNSEATLTTLRQGSGEERVELDLKGDAGLKFAQSKDENRVQRVRVAGHSIEIKPGLQTSDADVQELDGGRVRVTAKAGHVLVDDKTQVFPGETVVLAPEQAPEVKRVSAPVELTAGKGALINYDKWIPKVGFNWTKKADQKTYVFELSTNKKFTPLLFAEELPNERMVYDQFAPGQYQWRVKVGDAYVGGSVAIGKDTSTVAKANRVNTVDDTGESTVVYFQRSLPAITFRWKAVANAANYRIKVFRDDDFDQPLVNKVVNDTDTTLPPSTFEEGGFLWLISALDATGKALTTGKMNNLQIAFDNAVSELVIKTPKKSDVTRVKKLITRGEAQIGTGLSINGKAVGLDDKGRFGEPIFLEPGPNFVVYKVNARDGLERYYLRDVILK